ncbi:OmpP1/FadL family transporter [Rhizobium sp. TRM95111]|uniref:OmpP1/FadL family transporter n=1 Tax=Rhizobium alarense TaxID=2846851 RepID=UPI001F303BA4|nr:OmpP1/FadL family transporter [Rhizobium alarense]MCF3642432.1 OmpP1/FadL family transporter [Rhizobium alarense]
MKRLLKPAPFVMAAIALAGPATAGGLERGGYDIDLLFENSPFIFDSSITYVMPKRTIKNAKDESVDETDPTNLNTLGYSSEADEYESYDVPYLGMKGAVGDAIDCIIDYSEPWGAHSNPGRTWAGAKDMTEIKVYSRNYGGTCSYKFDAGPGQFRLIGGAFYQEVGGFKEAVVVPSEILAASGFSGYSGLGMLRGMEGDGVGWRAGVAYEIPEYAMRASLVYNSSVDLGDITGTLDLSGVPLALNPLGRDVTPVIGTATMPDSLELKVQSGFAPDWLAFASVKWTNWSRLQTVEFRCNPAGGTVCFPGDPVLTSLDLFYRDGWTVTGGVGHKFDENWSGGASLTWDRGTSTVTGSQSDTWTVGLATVYAPTENVELRLAGAVSMLTSGESRPVNLTTTSYDYGTDWSSAVSAGLKIKF